MCTWKKGEGEREHGGGRDPLYERGRLVRRGSAETPWCLGVRKGEPCELVMYRVLPTLWETHMDGGRGDWSLAQPDGVHGVIGSEFARGSLCTVILQPLKSLALNYFADRVETTHLT